MGHHEVKGKPPHLPPPLVCHMYDGKTSTVKVDAPVTALTRLGSSFAGYKPDVYQQGLTVLCAYKQYCNRSKSHSAQMEPWSDLFS